MKLCRLLVICVLGTIGGLQAEENKEKCSTPLIKIDVPKDHLFLVGVDFGDPGNRGFGSSGLKESAGGVHPALSRYTQAPAKIELSLMYPEKRKDATSFPNWTLTTSWNYVESSARTANSITSMSVPYEFQMATKKQVVVYQAGGVVYHADQINIIESPIGSPAERVLEEVNTGVEGLRFYQFPYGQVDGQKRYIVVVVSDSFEKAKKALKVSGRNPRFKWDRTWFH